MAITASFSSPNRDFTASRVVFTRHSSTISPSSPRKQQWLHSSPRSIPTVSFIFRLFACSALCRVFSLLFLLFFFIWLAPFLWAPLGASLLSSLPLLAGNQPSHLICPTMAHAVSASIRNCPPTSGGLRLVSTLAGF